MSRISIRENQNNIIVEYSVPTINSIEKAVSWIDSILKSNLFRIKRIWLDDETRSADEGNTSTSISGNISEKDLLDLCLKNETDDIAVCVRMNELPIIIGIDLGNLKPYIIIDSSKQKEIRLLEDRFNLV